MPMLAWRNKTAPALVPYYDEAQDVVLLRVVKKAQRRSIAIKIPSRTTSTTVDSRESRSSLVSEHGLYSSEGEAIQSFPVEVQTDSMTLRNINQTSNKPRFVYCEELKQNILEEIDFVDFRSDQNEGAVPRRRSCKQTPEPRVDPPTEREPQGAIVKPLEQVKREPPNLLDVLSMEDLETATYGQDAESQDDADLYPQMPLSGQGFSVLCSPVFSCTPAAAKSMSSHTRDVPYEVRRSPTELSIDDATWVSGSVTLNEMPGMFDSVIDQMDRALGDFEDDDEDTLEGESLEGESIFGPQPIGLGLTPTYSRADPDTGSLADDTASWTSEPTIDHDASRRRSVLETIVGAFWAQKRGPDETINIVKSDKDRGKDGIVGPPIPVSNSRGGRMDAMDDTLGSWDERDEHESLLDDDEDESTYYTLSFSPRSDATATAKLASVHGMLTH